MYLPNYNPTEMKKKTLLLLGALLCYGSVALQAQQIRNAAERASDHRQIQVDRATLERDQQELNEFRSTLSRLENAVENERLAVARECQQRLVASMEKEVKQGKAKIERAGKEVVGSRSELRSESRELRGDRRSNKPRQAADDRRDKRDDRRDLQDDKSDLNELRLRNARQREILADFRLVKVRNNPRACQALQAKRGLLLEFERTMRRDMGENVEELREDQGELREDRRETREDRRQR